MVPGGLRIVSVAVAAVVVAVVAEAPCICCAAVVAVAVAVVMAVGTADKLVLEEIVAVESVVAADVPVDVDLAGYAVDEPGLEHGPGHEPEPEHWPEPEPDAAVPVEPLRVPLRRTRWG